MPADRDDRAAEFDMLMARAGITVPPDLRGDLLAAYPGLCEQTALLHGQLGPADEPSNTFRLYPLEGR